MSTKLLYLEDFNLLEASAQILSVLAANDRITIILDQTIFYPQGGGQLFDQGIIESPSGKFTVEEIRFVDGEVRHFGKFISGKIEPGEVVKCLVDKARRNLNSRLHSAGHVVDMAVSSLGLKWTPGKGYHFPEGPYVEYIGGIAEVDKEKLRMDIENVCNRLITKGRATKLLFMPKEQMKSVCHFVPDYIPEGKPARVVMYGDFGIPCGGTHVSNINEIEHMVIRKIKVEKGNIRVAYDIER